MEEKTHTGSVSVHNLVEAWFTAAIMYYLLYGNLVTLIVSAQVTFMDKGGKIYSFTCRQPRGWVIRVEDTGKVCIQIPDKT